MDCCSFFSFFDFFLLEIEINFLKVFELKIKRNFVKDVKKSSSTFKKKHIPVLFTLDYSLYFSQKLK